MSVTPGDALHASLLDVALCGSVLLVSAVAQRALPPRASITVAALGSAALTALAVYAELAWMG